MANELRDSGNFPGAPNQILASTGTGTRWVNPPGSGGSGNFSEIVVTGNTGLGDDENDTTNVAGDATFGRDVTIVRNPEIQRDLTVRGDSHLDGRVFDSTGLPGDPDQFLSSTGGGTLWIDPPSGGGGTNCVCVDFEVPGAMNVDSSGASFTVPLDAQGPFNFIRNVVTDLVQVSPSTNPFSPVVQVTATSDFSPMVRFHNFQGTAHAVQVQGATEMSGDATINGDLFVSGAIINPSDARLKRNVKQIEDALAIVAKLRGVRFDWRRDDFPDRRFPDGRQVGFIAQELREALPELVKEDDEGFQSVDYAKVTAVLAEAVKELDQKVKERDARFEQLSARLERIEALLAERSSESKLASNGSR